MIFLICFQGRFWLIVNRSSRTSLKSSPRFDRSSIDSNNGSSRSTNRIQTPSWGCVFRNSSLLLLKYNCSIGTLWMWVICYNGYKSITCLNFFLRSGLTINFQTWSKGMSNAMVCNLDQLLSDVVKTNMMPKTLSTKISRINFSNLK